MEYEVQGQAPGECRHHFTALHMATAIFANAHPLSLVGKWYPTRFVHGVAVL